MSPDPRPESRPPAPPAAPAPGPNRGIGLAVAGAAVLAIAGGAAFWYASQQRGTAPAEGAIEISVDATSCDPATLSVPGGRRSFVIVNRSDRPIEWEILDGVMVVAERENIAPGFRSTLEVQLAPGEYAMTCGLLSNPRGRLTVTPSDEAAAVASEVTLRKFLGPLSEYRVFVMLEAGQAVERARALRGAIARGDLDAARRAWAEARLPYRRIEPVAQRISDLENAIDPAAAYLAGREADPAFTGYHRLEYGLFAQGSTEGLGPVADRLVADLETLSQRLGALSIAPGLMVALPAEAAAQAATAWIPSGEDPWAHQDLPELAASLDGIAKPAGLLAPIAAGVDPALPGQIDAALKAARDALAAAEAEAAQAGGGYDRLPAERREALAAAFNGLAETLGRLEPAIGMK